MPQLRDSGNHSSSPLDAGTLREVHSFARIFGIETEYGVSVTGADAPCDASQTAMMMFQPIIASARSTNTYIENGSRLYLDVGSHPEYATSEACDPMDALAVDAAGDARPCVGRPAEAPFHLWGACHSACVQKQRGFRGAFVRLS